MRWRHSLLSNLGACLLLSCVNILWRTGYLSRLGNGNDSQEYPGIPQPQPQRSVAVVDVTPKPQPPQVESVVVPKPKQANSNTHPQHSQHYEIPRIVHQTYKSTSLPPNFQSWRDECIAQNPTWEFRIWTDEDNLRLVQEHYPHFLALYEGYDSNIKRIDMVRFLYLHKFGGVYMDMDMTCLKPFGSTLDQYYGKLILANQYPANKHIIEYANAFMASTPRLEIFDSIFHELTQPHRKDQTVLVATGSKFLKRFVLRKRINEGKWVGFPMELIYGHEWTEEGTMCTSLEDCRNRFPEAITVSFWTHTWKDDGGDDIRKWQ
mmetsp:Transcript_27338/g.57718  ORF Transcript_27338/g.57718 Transcript_27338/m.57718 type:complete len:320 (+) Transcript_27338:52-1011(+)